MTVRSCRFGTVEVPEERILHFVQPILGFAPFEHYALVEDPESHPVLWMQALHAPEVLFPVVDPRQVADGYHVDLEPGQAEALGVERVDDLRLLCILTLSTDPAAITVNLRAPIAWNTRRATAMQLVLGDHELPITSPVRAAAGGRGSNKEVARACADAPQE
jgi:flagellar assembly factor FliW